MYASGSFRLQCRDIPPGCFIGNQNVKQTCRKHVPTVGGLCNIIGRTFCFVMVIMLLVFRKFTLNIIILQVFFNKINENRRKKCRVLTLSRNKTQYYVVVKTYK